MAVTCTAAWALLGELAEDAIHLATDQTRATRRRAAGTRVGRTATSIKLRWISFCAQLPEVCWAVVLGLQNP